MCDAKQDFQAVANLINRWSGSGSSSSSSLGGGGSCYVLCAVDLLPLDQQQRALDLIRACLLDHSTRKRSAVTSPPNSGLAHLPLMITPPTLVIISAAVDHRSNILAANLMASRVLETAMAVRKLVVRESKGHMYRENTGQKHRENKGQKYRENKGHKHRLSCRFARI